MKIFAAILILISVLFFTYLVSDGVELTIINKSSTELDDIKVEYGKGIWSLGNLAKGASASKDLGRIGEGAEFTVSWKDKNQKAASATGRVYFFDDGSKLSVEIVLTDETAEIIYMNHKAIMDI